MTVLQAVKRFDLLYPNALSLPQKRGMLSELDGTFFHEVKKLYEDCEAAFSPYADASDDNRELLIPFPADELYIQYLLAQNDLVNGDIARYNNSSALFDLSYAQFVRRYHREHKLKKTNRIAV